MRWKAANAISVALRDNRLDREGVLNYIKWWKKSYPEFDDYRNFLMGMPFSRIFSEEETIYLFSLFESPLRSTLNPFLLVRTVKKALEPMMPQIQKEMPTVVEKLKMLKVEKLDKFLLDIRNRISL